MFISFKSQMPWRGLTLGLLCGEGCLGLRFSNEAKAVRVTLDMTFSWKHPQRRNLGLFIFMTPAPIITALDIKWTLRKFTGLHVITPNFHLPSVKIIAIIQSQENRVFGNFLKPFDISSRKIVHDSLEE